MSPGEAEDELRHLLRASADSLDLLQNRTSAPVDCPVAQVSVRPRSRISCRKADGRGSTGDGALACGIALIGSELFRTVCGIFRYSDACQSGFERRATRGSDGNQRAAAIGVGAVQGSARTRYANDVQLSC
jgi:hypothetical protein